MQRCAGYTQLFCGEVAEPAVLQMDSENQQNALRDFLQEESIDFLFIFLHQEDMETLFLLMNTA